MKRVRQPDVQSMTFLVPQDAASWAERMENACLALESRFGISLSQVHSGTKFRLTVREIEDRPKYLRQRARTKTRWFSLSSRQSPCPAAAQSSAALGQLSFGGTMYDGGELFSAMCAIEPAAAFDESLLVQLGDALHAHSAPYLPRLADERIRLAHRCIGVGPSAFRLELADKLPEEEALPLICESLYTGLAPLQPHHLGWINYWSREVCEYVGFPQNLAGSAVLQHCYRTPAGAWIIKLGSEPFEPRNVAQLELLRDMYQRFPRVGIRAAAKGPPISGR